MFPVVVVPKHLGLFCLKILLFSNSTALTGSLREAKGHRGAGGLAVRRLCTLSTLKSPKMQPKPLWAHTPCVCVCVTACSVCADRANSVGEYAPQITPLERLRVGKQSSAKRWCPGPRWVLTHNASRGPAGCCGLSFIFYKACCLLQHVPSAQAGVTSCSPGLLDMAPHSPPACHQPDLLTPELPTRSPCQLPISYAGFLLKLMDYFSIQINNTLDQIC